MEAQSYIKTPCTHCGGHIEAPAEGAGMWVHCPHCGEKTQLGAASPPESPTPKKSKAWIWVVLCVMVLAAVASVFILHKPQKLTPKQSPVQSTVKVESPQPPPEPKPEPDLWKGLKPTPVSIEKSSNSRLVYAVGTIRNDTDKQRYGIKVTLDVLDAKGEKLGTATDYSQFIDAHKEWSFKALVTYPKAAAAKITAITEE